MIETFFGLGRLNSPQAYFAAFCIGLLFGFLLERAGFGSSRRLAGIFYFRDMAVLKVMFTAMITAMLGLSGLLSLGWIRPDQLYFMSTVYGAYIVGGLLFGIGFVMSGWCPGTAVVGLASGKWDALLFLVGATLGSILFNELYSAVKPLYNWGQAGVSFIYEVLGMPRMAFGLLFTALAVACFWGAEYIEKRRNVGGIYFNTPFLRAFSLAFLVFAGGLLILPPFSHLAAAPRNAANDSTRAQAGSQQAEVNLLAAVEAAEDHVEPMELADRLMAGDPHLVLVDIRTPEEFNRFHIRGAINVGLTDLPEFLAPYKNTGIVVLYSNGMTHPAQARDALSRLGFENVYILTDGLKGFLETCLKPASLRSAPAPRELAEKIRACREYFMAEQKLSMAGPPASLVDDEGSAAGAAEAGFNIPGLIDTEWLGVNFSNGDVKIIDLRTQPEYNTSHIPGSIFLSIESLRGVVNGVPSMLLPAELLALHLGQMGIKPADLVVLVPGNAVRDATLVAMALERLGHRRYAVLDGGFGKWKAEQRPVDNRLPVITQGKYPLSHSRRDTFTVDHQTVLRHIGRPGVIILDVRPKEYFTGEKSDEARAGRIPGAVNRPYTEDVSKKDGQEQLKPTDELAAAYAALIPSTNSTVIIHCRTGHQASQTFFILKNLLGYSNVLYYDAGWTEWAAHPELPIETGPAK
jgi:3-mercaptopyruvate sulfurtransferase SseA/uncharacterized membrane protein YedE/YeeE